MRELWTEDQTRRFLFINSAETAESIADFLHRSKYAIQSMRRKLKHLRKLGARPTEMAKLLTVNEQFVMAHTLQRILARAELLVIPVRGFYRRNRLSPGHHLVRACVRGGKE